MARFGPFRPAFAVILAVAALTACSRQEAAPGANYQQVLANPGPPVPGDWVIARTDSDPDSLNPLTSQTANAGWIEGNIICEGMLRLNNDTLKLEPCLAESWEISPDQLTYTFHLRHDVKWHDGQPFTADDVKFTYDKLMDPKVDAAPIRSYFTTVKACDVIDPYTVRFTASERYFKTLEAIGGLSILPKHAFDHGDPDFNKNDFGRHPIGTGPYKFVRWDTGSQIVVERNDDYWGPKPNLKRLVFQTLSESYVAAQLIKKGQLDVFENVSPILWARDLDGTRSMNHLKELVYPYPMFRFMGFNTRPDHPFTDVRVRHAIDLLIPRDEIIKQIFLGKYATKTSGFDPPTSRNYNQDVKPTPYDSALAQQLLAEAGWKINHGDGILYKDGKPLRFTLVYGSGNADVEKTAELVQESLKRVGIDMQLSRLQFAQLVDKVNDWQFDAVMMGFTSDINGDPWQLWNSADAEVKKSSNFVGYKNAQVDDLMKQGRLEYDDEKRAAIFRQVHQIIHDDYPMCFLTNPKLITVVDDRFENVKTFPPGPCFDMTQWWVPGPLQKYRN